MYQTKDAAVHLRLSPKQLEWAKRMADQRGMTVSGLIREALSEYLFRRDENLSVLVDVVDETRK